LNISNKHGKQPSFTLVPPLLDRNKECLCLLTKSGGFATHPVINNSVVGAVLGAVATQKVNSFINPETVEVVDKSKKDEERIKILETENAGLKTENAELKEERGESKKHHRNLSGRNDSLIDKLIISNENANDCKHNLTSARYAFQNSYCFWRQQPVWQISSTPKAQEIDANRSILKK
jgi:hypothetical protein